MPHDLETRLVALARRQHGVAAHAQLLELGMTGARVSRWTAAGRFRRLHRGVYLIVPVVAPRGREMAAVLAAGAAGVLSHGSALSDWGIRTVRRDRASVEVTVVGGAAGRHPGIRIRRVAWMDEAERTTRDGIPITTPGRTLLDVAGWLDGRELERAVARALRERLVDEPSLGALVARHAGRKGVRRLRAILRADAGPSLTESEAEERFFSLAATAGFSRPRTNVDVAGCRVDFYWPDVRLAVEIDGYAFHSSRPRFESDRRRAAHLAAQGVQVISLTWRQVVDEPLLTAVQLAQALVRAEGR